LVDVLEVLQPRPQDWHPVAIASHVIAQLIRLTKICYIKLFIKNNFLFFCYDFHYKNSSYQLITLLWLFDF
jgi:hypothetical protein